MKKYCTIKKSLVVGIFFMASLCRAMTPEQRAELSTPASVESNILWGKEQQLLSTSKLAKDIDGVESTIRLWVSQSKRAKVNVMTDYSLDDLDTCASSVKSFIHKHKSEGRSFAGYIYRSRHNDIDKVRKTCRSLGFLNIYPFAAMICFLDDLEPLYSIDFFDCQQVSQFNTKQPWLDIATECFDHDDYMNECYDNLIMGQNTEGNVFFYVGLHNHEAVSIGSLVVNKDKKYGVLQNIGTKKGSRKNGFATQLSHHILNEAKLMGLTHVVLTAAADAQKIYEKIGFSQVSTIDIYVS